jgi:hypothetical protein
MLSYALLVPGLAALLLVGGACNKAKVQAPAVGPGPGGRGAPSPIREIMGKLTVGMRSTTVLIGEELRTDPPAWDKIRPQSKEYAQLTATMGNFDPPKGSKDSWAKLTSAFAGSAAALQKAADAKDKEGALAAHKALMGSCMACHLQHRVPQPGNM